ncbi:hydrolase [Microbacterium phage Burro]|uniref:Hydrolase n=1 Tax=Microbacterium phage Burro TaxID=2315703 RepID=A0A386KKK0_9CAUD|nr:minor tail protein [Microbacterium phage Burro]AYD86175.1 hydrolase [Microbacterium phage Burro]
MVTKAVGTAGTMEIIVGNPNVSFKIYCSDPITNVNYNWSGTVNGVAVGGTVRLDAGFGSRVLGTWSVGYSQTVTFNQGATGTQGLGGANSLSASVTRTTVPSAPPAPTFISSTPTSLRFQIYQPASNGGSAVTSYTMAVYLPVSMGGGLVSTWTGGSSIQETPASADLDRSISYRVQYRAQNAIGLGAWSSLVNMTTANTIPDQPPPVLPGAITTTTIPYTAPNPTYTGGSLTAREVVLMNAAGTTILQTKTTGLTDTFTGATRATDYSIKHRVQNAVGWSAYSDLVPVRTLTDLPSAPTGYNHFDVASTSARVSAGVIADNGGQSPTNARIQYNTTPSATGASIKDNGYWGDSTLTGLSTGTTYHYREAAFNEAGWGPYGAWQSFTTKSNVPSAPTGLSASSITDFTAALGWTLPIANGSTVLSIELRVATNPSFSTGVQTFSLPPTTVTQALGGLSAATKYYAQVWSNSSNGLGSSSPIIDFTTTGSGGLANPYWIKVAGTWRKVIQCWVKVGGVWMPAIPWKKISGVWRVN